MQQITFRAMNCQMLAAVDREGPRTAERLEQVPGWFEVWEQRLSRFRPDSELSQINLHAGREVKVSPVMHEVLREALRAGRDSDGLVSPLVLDALEASGYSRSFDEMDPEVDRYDGLDGNRGWTAQVSSIDSAPMSIQLNARSRTVQLASSARLDLGGIAKGWAADRAARRLSRLGPALVDSGGDIAVNGPMADGEPWPVGVTDPFDSQKQIDLLLLDRGGVATSGRDYRRWLKDRVWQHHIIDPRSGLPAQTDVLTATVVAPSAQVAEMAAKVVLILGSWQGIHWLERRPELAGLLVLDDGEIVQSRRWTNYIWR